MYFEGTLNNLLKAETLTFKSIASNQNIEQKLEVLNISCNRKKRTQFYLIIHDWKVYKGYYLFTHTYYINL